MTAVAAASAVAAAAPVTDADMSLGDPKAKITVIEYESVACPVCGHWNREIYPAFKAKYVDTGKVRYVAREMLVGDPGEVAEASAGFLTARCAGKANYFKVIDAIFENQPQLWDNPHDLLVRIGGVVGLSEAKVDACIADQRAINALNARVEAYVTQDHVRSTPTFVINGRAMEPGYKELSALDSAIADAQAGR